MMEFDINHGYDKTVLKKNYPDFTAVGYQVIQELGHNREGGRITYLAHHLHSHQKVVIKEFSFANMTTD